ncbi:MAG: diphosphomevalonate decarboxylase [Anaerolineae bacterium]|nr:diphosphomevalonate decarboxylase [Anaerolineae bacterium]
MAQSKLQPVNDRLETFVEKQKSLRERAAAEKQATAIAHPNIAFIKYWGNEDDILRLPANPSLSMNLGSLHTLTTVSYDDNLPGDRLVINQEPVTDAALARVTAHLDLVRRQARLNAAARVESTSNFPIGSGIASSAAAFAALSVAAAAAAGLWLDEAALSRLARRGSGSASRSVPGGYCQWVTGNDKTSIATSVAPPEHWDLRDIIVIASQEHKSIGSSDGHRLAKTASLQAARVAGAEARLQACREALLARNLAKMGPVIEEDAVMMHAVMMSSRPPLYYWNTVTMDVIQATQHWRAKGLPVYFTIDAGPNVHLICEAKYAATVESEARKIPGVEDVLISGPGGPARLVDSASTVFGKSIGSGYNDR